MRIPDRKILYRRGLQLLFILLTLGTLVFLDQVLSFKSGHGIDQARGLYAQPRNTVDVVLMGSSHIHCDVNTGLLWEQEGIAAYDYSAAEQPLWITYHYLKEFCRYQDPKVVVLDLYSPARFKDNYQYQWLHESLNGMRPSLNRLQMLLTSCEPDRLQEFYPPFVNYHSRYDELAREDWLYPFTWKRDLRSFKGFTPYFEVSPQTRPVLTEETSGGLTVKSADYLQKIMDYCREREIQLFLIVTPYVTIESDQRVYNRIEEIAQQNGLAFHSAYYHYDTMSLDFENDFSDDSHLNYRGARKFTEHLCSQLKARYDLPDHRGDPRYSSWDDNAAKIRGEIALHERS